MATRLVAPEGLQSLPSLVFMIMIVIGIIMSIVVSVVILIIIMRQRLENSGHRIYLY